MKILLKFDCVVSIEFRIGLIVAQHKIIVLKEIEDIFIKWLDVLYMYSSMCWVNMVNNCRIYVVIYSKILGVNAISKRTTMLARHIRLFVN